MVDGTWSSGSPIPASNYLSQCAPGSAGIAYLIGGIENSANSSTIRTYNINTNTWGILGTLGVNIRESSGGIVGNKLYVIGGRTDTETRTDDIYEVDLTTGSVITKSAKLPGNRDSLTRGAVHDNYIYVFGGKDETQNACNTCYRYNTTLDTVDTMATIPINFRDGVVVWDSQYAYLVTGYDDVGVGNHGWVARYDFTANSWATLTALGTPIRETVGELHNGTIFVWGGFTNTTVDYGFSYNISTDTWAESDSLLVSTRLAASYYYSGTSVVFGGYNGGGDLSTVQVYSMAGSSGSTYSTTLSENFSIGDVFKRNCSKKYEMGYSLFFG